MGGTIEGAPKAIVSHISYPSGEAGSVQRAGQMPHPRRIANGAHTAGLAAPSHGFGEPRKGGPDEVADWLLPAMSPHRAGDGSSRAHNPCRGRTQHEDRSRCPDPHIMLLMATRIPAHRAIEPPPGKRGDAARPPDPSGRPGSLPAPIHWMRFRCHQRANPCTVRPCP
jgi:hypothetical protein